MTTPEMVDQWSLEKSLAFYKDRFSDASDFTFVFFGDFDPAALKPLAEQYPASLPATHRKETWKDVGVHTPTGVIEKTVEKGIEPKSQVVMEFTGPFQWDQTQRIAIRAMGQVLQERPVGRDGEPAAAVEQAHDRVSLASATSRAAGSPTCIQSPSIRRPCSRPAAAQSAQ